MKWKRGERPGRERRTRSQRRAIVRDRARKGLALLPSMLTLGNLVCGFYAIVHVGAVQWEGQAPVPADSFQVAAFAILLGMVFDMLDGRVARMTKSTSEFGAQLDSLADVVTFGTAPAVLVAMIHAMGRYDGFSPTWSKMAWVFGAAYACAAATRLARFNVETESQDEEAHLVFKGLPSPAAAGVIATLVLVHTFLLSDRADARLAWIDPNVANRLGLLLLDTLPFVALGCGYLMVSKFNYPHVANRYLRGRKPAEYLYGLIFAAVLAAMFPEISAALVFCGFAISGPIAALRGRSADGDSTAPDDGDDDDGGDRERAERLDRDEEDEEDEERDWVDRAADGDRADEPGLDRDDGRDDGDDSDPDPDARAESAASGSRPSAPGA